MTEHTSNHDTNSNTFTNSGYPNLSSHGSTNRTPDFEPTNDPQTIFPQSTSQGVQNLYGNHRGRNCVPGHLQHPQGSLVETQYDSVVHHEDHLQKGNIQTTHPIIKNPQSYAPNFQSFHLNSTDTQFYVKPTLNRLGANTSTPYFRVNDILPASKIRKPRDRYRVQSSQNNLDAFYIQTHLDGSKNDQQRTISSQIDFEQNAYADDDKRHVWQLNNNPNTQYVELESFNQMEDSGLATLGRGTNEELGSKLFHKEAIKGESITGTKGSFSSVATMDNELKKDMTDVSDSSLITGDFPPGSTFSKFDSQHISLTSPPEYPHKSENVNIFGQSTQYQDIDVTNDNDNNILSQYNCDNDGFINATLSELRNEALPFPASLTSVNFNTNIMKRIISSSYDGLSPLSRNLVPPVSPPLPQLNTGLQVDNDNNNTADKTIHRLGILSNEEFYRLRCQSVFGADDLKTHKPDFKIIDSDYDPLGESLDLTNLKYFNNDKYNIESVYISKNNETIFKEFQTKKFNKFSSTTISKLIFKNIASLYGTYDLFYSKMNKVLFEQSKHTEPSLLSISNELLKQWEATDSYYNSEYCSCGYSIWHSGSSAKTELLNCPYDPDSNISPKQLPSFRNRKESHTKTSFSLNLFNDYIVSILLNKKLRAYLKKTLRVPKTLDKKSKYLNLIQDGELYRESMKDYAGQVDFSFTFTMISPTFSTPDANLCCVYFVLNELPPSLRYKPEFMFLATIVNIDQNPEWLKRLFMPLFQYLEYLEENILKVSLNRHEYLIKACLLLTMGTDRFGKDGLLDIYTASYKFQCVYCLAPRCTVRDGLGREYKVIYNTERYRDTKNEIYLSLKNRGILVADKGANHWSLNKSFFLDPLMFKNDFQRCLLIDVQNWILKGIFKEGILALIKNHMMIRPNKAGCDSFEDRLIALDTALAIDKIFVNPNFLSATAAPAAIPNAVLSDLKALNTIFPLLFQQYFGIMYESLTELSKVLQVKFKGLSVLIEFNCYISAIFCTEIEREKLQLVKAGFIDLIKEFEYLAKLDLFASFNIVLMLPLHYMTHLYEKWDDYGDLTAHSYNDVEASLKDAKRLSRDGKIGFDEIPRKVRLYNIVNSVKIANFVVPNYPDFTFNNFAEIEKKTLSERVNLKIEEFPKRFLLDYLTSNSMPFDLIIEKIESFTLDGITITPVPDLNPRNFVRIKSMKKSSNWRFAYIHNMYQIKYYDVGKDETFTGVLFEFKEAKTTKRFQRSSVNRPPFSLGEYLSSKSSSREVRCMWLDDVQMVALRILNESDFIYDPKMLLERVFQV